MMDACEYEYECECDKLFNIKSDSFGQFSQYQFPVSV